MAAKKGWTECAECGAPVMKSNVDKHMSRIHGDGPASEPLAPGTRPSRIRSGSSVVPILVAVVVVIGLAGFAVVLSASPGADGNVGFAVGQFAPNFSLDDVDTGRFSLSNFRGQPVVITFMASWCSSCILEHREIQNIFNSYASRGVQFISVSLDFTDTANGMRTFKAQYGNGAQHIFALDTPQKRVSVTYAANLDSTYILDGSGVIAYRDSGLTTAPTFAAELDKIV